EGAPASRGVLDTGFAQAFTNPIWITVGGQPVRNLASAEYCIKWIDKLQALAEGEGSRLRAVRGGAKPVSRLREGSGADESADGRRRRTAARCRRGGATADVRIRGRRLPRVSGAGARGPRAR